MRGKLVNPMVIGPCGCCGRERAIFSQPSARDLPESGKVCALCMRHLGNMEHDLRKRESVHRQMWAEDLRETIEEYEARITDLQAEHEAEVRKFRAELDAEIAKRPVQVVEHYIGQDVIDKAYDDRDRAYRTRDAGFRDLTTLHLVHYEIRGGKCRCGRRIDMCEEAQILDESRALKAWERRQAMRRSQGQSHQLPPGHPGVVDPRWGDDDYAEELFGPS